MDTLIYLFNADFETLDWSCSAAVVKDDPEAGLPNPQNPLANPSHSPSTMPKMPSASQSLVLPSGHMGPELIGAVHLPGPMSHSLGHMGLIPHHIGHVHGQSISMSQSHENVEGMRVDGGGMGVKAGYPGDAAFGFNPYADTEALSKLRESPAWISQVKYDVNLCCQHTHYW